MKKRLRKKKQTPFLKKVDVEITNIKPLEDEFNYIITFKCHKSRKYYQVQLLKFTTPYKYLNCMKSDLVNKTLLKGLIDFHQKDLFLHLPKYQIKTIDSALCLCHCVSSNFKTCDL